MPGLTNNNQVQKLLNASVGGSEGRVDSVTQVDVHQVHSIKKLSNIDVATDKSDASSKGAETEKISVILVATEHFCYSVF